MCLKESCFPDCWKASLVAPVFKNIIVLVFFLWLVKSFEKLVYKYVAFFSDFQYGFRSSQSTADLLTAVSDRISRAF